MAIAYFWDGTKWEPLLGGGGGGGGGVPGPQGPPGAAGADGQDGAPGEKGDKGDQGDPGLDAPVSSVAGSPDTATGAVGTSLDYARADHAHPFPTAADVGAITKTQGDSAYVLKAGDTMTGPLVVTAAPGLEADALTIVTDSGDLLYFGVKENPGRLGGDAVISTINTAPGGSNSRTTLMTCTADGRIIFGVDTGDRNGRVFVDESYYGSGFYARTKHKFPDGVYTLDNGEPLAGLSNFFAIAYPTVPLAGATTTSNISGMTIVNLRNAIDGDAGSSSGACNGIGLEYGHSSFTPTFSGTTSVVTGIRMNGRVQAGTITTYTDLLIAPPVGTGTITTRNSILQLDTVSRNAFLSRTGIGQYPSATRILDVTGDVQFIGNFTVTTGTTVRFPARTVNYDCLGPLTIRIASADTTFALTDCSRAVLNASLTAGTVTYTIPDNTTVPIPIGSMIRVYDCSRLGTTAIQGATGVTLFWRNAAGTVAGGAAQTLTLSGEVNFVEMIKTGTNTWYAFGDTK